MVQDGLPSWEATLLNENRMQHRLLMIMLRSNLHTLDRRGNAIHISKQSQTPDVPHAF